MKEVRCDVCSTNIDGFEGLEGVSKKDRFDMLREKERKLLETYGHYIHYVSDTDPIDAHTHGLHQFGLPELQLRLSCISAKTAMHILNTLAENMRNGERYTTGKYYEDERIMRDGYEFTFIDAGKDTEGNPILRVILPDNNHYFPWDKECNHNFKKQMVKNEY